MCNTPSLAPSLPLELSWGFLRVLACSVVLVGCLGWLSWLVVLVGCLGWLSWLVVLVDVLLYGGETRKQLTLQQHGRVGLVVMASSSRAKDPRFESRLRRDFPGSSHTSDLKIGTPVAALLGAWCYKVSAGTGWPGVSIL